MFLSLFGRTSASATHTVRENHRLAVNLAAAEERLGRLMAAYVVEVEYPGSDPACRFRALLPDGQPVYRGTREEAEAAVRAAAER